MKVLIGAYSKSWGEELAGALNDLGIESTVELSPAKIEAFMLNMQKRLPIEEKGLVLSENIGTTSVYDLLWKLEQERKDQTLRFPFGSLVLATEMAHDEEIIDILKRRGVVALSSAQDIGRLAKVTNDAVMASVRSSLRVSVVWDATIEVEGKKIGGHIHDLSTGGVLFRPKKYGEAAALSKSQLGSIKIETEFEDFIECRFEIQWRKEYKKFLRHGVGLGLKFVDTDETLLEKISGYVESVRNQQMAVAKASSMFYF